MRNILDFADALLRRFKSSNIDYEIRSEHLLINNISTSSTFSFSLTLVVYVMKSEHILFLYLFSTFSYIPRESYSVLGTEGDIHFHTALQFSDLCILSTSLLHYSLSSFIYTIYIYIYSSSERSYDRSTSRETLRVRKHRARSMMKHIAATAVAVLEEHSRSMM